MRKYILLITLLSFTGAKLFAQNQSSFRQFKIEHWDSKKGMPGDLCLDVYQTKDGFIWLTGFNGLVRFDGMNFTNFNQRTVPQMKIDNVDAQLIETADTTLWIPTQVGGLLSYRKGIFTTYLTEFTSLRFIGKTSQDELLLAMGRGEFRFILFNTHSYKYKEITDSIWFQMIKDEKIIRKNRFDSAGNQWMMIRRDAPMRIKNGVVITLTEKEGIQKGISYIGIYVDSKDRVWLTSSNGLFLWNGIAMMPYAGMETEEFNPGNGTGNLFIEDSQGGIWAATRRGLAYLEPGSDRFSFLPENVTQQAQNISGIREDKEKNIWLASETGLSRISKSKFANYSMQDGFNSNRVNGACPIDNQKYIVGSAPNLFLIDNGNLKPYPFKNPEIAKMKIDASHIFRDSKNNIWVCHASNNGKIIKLSPAGETVFNADNQVRYAFEDRDHKMWFGIAYMGIGFINDKSQLEYLNLPKINFKTIYLSSIRKLQNDNWLVTSFNKGILLIDKSGNPIEIENKPILTSIGAFSSFEEKDATVWISSQSGIIRYKNGIFSEIGFKDGLPANSIFGFLPDQKGYVWLSCNIGIIRVLKKEIDDYLDKKIDKINWQVFDDGDGMLNRQCVGARHAAITPDGKLLFPTLGGLVVVDPDKLSKNMLPPSVVVHRVLRDNEQTDLTKNNVFSPGTHRYIFEYSALSFIAPEKVKFKFRLIGYDKEWINAVGERKAFYTNLPSGNYTFQVIASNNDGVWNETGASFSFTVSPFFYETTWFRIIAILFVVALIWTVVRWRTQAARKQNILLEAQVVSRTKDLNKANSELSQSNTELAIKHENLTKAIDNLKSTQSQLIQSEKMASLGELTAGIAHEIQNPLNFVNNFSEINTELIDELNVEVDKGNIDEVKAIAKDIKENEQKINHHGNRAADIVKGMLQHSSSSSGKKESTDINKLADEYFRLAYHGLRAKDPRDAAHKSFNATMKTDFDETIGNINIIPQDIGRVILNLITNAFYVVNERLRQAPRENRDGQPASPEMTSFEKMSSLYEPTVSVATRKSGDKIFISVKDNGNGIPQKVLDKIFQPFFTTKPTGQGTGLGLSLSYDIVKAHGGELKVETKEGEGSIFIIQLPTV